MTHHETYSAYQIRTLELDGTQYNATSRVISFIMFPWFYFHKHESSLGIVLVVIYFYIVTEKLEFSCRNPCKRVLQSGTYCISSNIPASLISTNLRVVDPSIIPVPAP